MSIDKSRKMAIATASAKRAGLSNFKKGSKGAAKREEIAMAIHRKLTRKGSY